MENPATNTDPLATRDAVSLPSTGRDQTITGDPMSPERSAVVGREANGEGGGGSGRLEVRCPNCHAPTSVATDSALTELVCSTCGSNFSLVDNHAASRQAPPLAHMGRFELIARVGMGAFGSVWKARDKQLDRTVAIKIPRQSTMTADEQEKFFREARTAAQLRHPNIVSVHEVGRDGESLYIVSDFVHGVTLGDWLTAQQLTSREAAELCAKIATALHHAHEQGVIHRDLKPANIMIDAAGEPHLMDFGLARREVGELTVTTDGQVLGTPAYMSPEQAAGESHTADARSDVYSLGVILFQLLTGEFPFRGNLRMLLHQVIHDEPPSPRKFNANVPKDLETVTLKCLEKDPARRYASASELTDEFQRYLRGEPILGRPIRRVERALRWVRQHRAIAALAGLMFLALFGGITVSTIFAINAHREAARANLAVLAEKTAKETAQASERETRAVLEFLQTKVLAAARPEGLEGGLGRDILLRDVIEATLPQVEHEFAAQPLIEARLRMTFGESFNYLGEPQKAANEFENARAIFTKHLGPEHEETLVSIQGLAGSYRDLGRYSESVELAEFLVTHRKEKLGSQHPETLGNMNRLASCYFDLGRYEESLAIWQDILRLQTTVLGADHPDTLRSMHNLSSGYFRLGRHAEAIKFLEQTLELENVNLGRSHPDTLVTLLNLAASYRRVGQYDRAIKIYKETLAILTTKLGPEHPYTLRCMSGLAASYGYVNRQDESVTLLRESLQLMTDKLGNDHPFTLDCMYALAQRYSAMNKHADAVGLLDELSTRRKVKLGPQHPDTLQTVNMLARMRATSPEDRVRDGREAIALATQLCEITEYSYPVYIDTLAAAFAETGDFEKAAELEEKAIKLLGSDSNKLRDVYLAAIKNYKSKTPLRIVSYDLLDDGHRPWRASRHEKTSKKVEKKN